MLCDFRMIKKSLLIEKFIRVKADEQQLSVIRGGDNVHVMS